MSEVNMNENVSVVVEDATVITIPIDDTLTVSGDAADAKAVGDALALKADLSQVVSVKVNGQSADNQGEIIVDGTEIAISSTDDTTLTDAISAVAGKTGTDIPINNGTSAESIETTVSGLQTQITTLNDNALKSTEQTLTSEQKTQARVNIGFNENGVLPVSLGGTGSSTAEAARTALGFETDSTTATGKGLTMYLYKYGNVVFFVVPAVQINASVTAGNSIITIPSGWRPAASCYCNGAHGGWDYAHHVVFEVTSGGSLVCKSNLTSGSATGLGGCYVI